MHAVLELPGNPSDSAQRGAVALLTGDAPRPWEWGYDALAVAEATEGHALYLTANTCFERLHLSLKDAPSLIPTIPDDHPDTLPPPEPPPPDEAQRPHRPPVPQPDTTQQRTDQPRAHQQVHDDGPDAAATETDLAAAAIMQPRAE